MFRFRKKKKFYDKEVQQPVIRASICTGEQAVGFKDLKTGKFEEIRVIRTEKDLALFMKEYDVVREDIMKEW